MRQVYLNGDFIPEDQAKVSAFDRGFLFGDGIYEVTLVLNGKLVDFDGHMARLKRSAGELALPFEADPQQLKAIHQELVRRNDLVEGMIYLQVTRGSAGDRDFHYPPEGTTPTLLLFTQKKNIVGDPDAVRGKKVITIEDLRWQRSDIKTVQLLFASMSKMRAKAEGADDAWFVHGDVVTEGTSNNAFIVTADGTIVTRELSTSILHGITRKAVIECISELGLKLEERPFTVSEALQAAEAFTTSATSLVTAVVSIDGSFLGTGTPGPVASRLREIYIRKSREAAID